VILPDDSSLTSSQLANVIRHADRLLREAGAHERYPTPVEDILSAAKLRVESKSLDHAEGFLAYLKQKSLAVATKAIDTLKAATSAFAKILGICDSADHTIYIDDTVNYSASIWVRSARQSG
jgi:hypothetical protein